MTCTYNGPISNSKSNTENEIPPSFTQLLYKSHSLPFSSKPIPLSHIMSLFHLLLILLLFTPFSSSSSTPPNRFIKSIPLSLHQKASHESFEVTHPLLSDQLTPSCSHNVLHHDFGDTVGLPPVSVPYSPPSDCPAPWSHVVLEIHAFCKGEQYNRIAGVWLNGTEILRTSTAKLTQGGIFWKVRKDVTRYSSLLTHSNLTLTVMLENVVDDVFTGVYNVDISLLYYKGNGVTVPFSGVADHQNLKRKLVLVEDHKTANFINEDSKLEFKSEQFVRDSVTLYRTAIDSVNREKSSLNLYETPADLIIPISSAGDEGFWFRIQSECDVHSKGIQIPMNTWKAVLEIYVSFHGNDEFWYLNPPDSYIRMNNLTTKQGHGAYREVFVTIDGIFVGSVVPFPVIFTGGINPLFWEPIVAIGAFNVPSYDFDLTPFLGLLLDRKIHFFALGVADSIPFWLVDANLHLWFDHDSLVVQANAVGYHSPTISIQRGSKFEQLDGSFRIEAERKSRFLGWVKSTAGNLTTHVLQHFKFKNSIRFQKSGTYKLVQLRVHTKTEVRVESDTGRLISHTIVKRKYPLRILTSTLPGSIMNTNLIVTNVSHALRERASSGGFSSSLHNRQDSWGWMMVKDHSVLSGAATTRQNFSYIDEFGCYSRIVAATNGKLVEDHSNSSCASSF